MTEIDPLEFRRVLGRLPTGVTVVTAHGPGGPTGMSANSLTSVSLDPPLILLCPAKTSTTWPMIRSAGRFCVNVMASHQETLCRQFARMNVDRFDGVAFHHRESGPALDEAIAWLDASVDAEHDAGDHTIVVARVRALQARSDGSPLVFFAGRYGTFDTAAVCT